MTKETAMKILKELHGKSLFAERTALETLIPELKESEDERVKKRILLSLEKDLMATKNSGCDTQDLEQCIAWFEKQGTSAKLSEEEQNKFAKGVLSSCALSFIDYLDAHKYEGKMCVSNGECEDIENAFHNAMWDRLHRYYCKYIEKQGEQKPDTNCPLSWSETDEKMLQSLEGIVKDYWAKAEQEKNEIKIREASNVSYFLKTIQKSPLCWIKCSDELPNRDGIYLVVTDGRHNDVYDMARYDSIEGWHKASEIIYWMPIPQLNNKSIIEQKPADNIEKPWSEDDNKHFERILKELENQWQRPLNRPYLDEIESDYNWLKSLRPQLQWKPSDEQMKALKMQ